VLKPRLYAIASSPFEEKVRIAAAIVKQKGEV
jgi:sulfite reductase alpha subunit-like flavoprotein